jgi:3'-5' exoribonuclease
MLKDLKASTVGTKFTDQTFMCSKVDFKPFKAKPGSFLSCELSDVSGAVKAILWEASSAQPYNDAPQILIKTITIATDFDMNQLIPSLPEEKINSLFGELKDIAAKINNPFCKYVWDSVLADERFRQCPGGVGDVHHAYLGGLLEHTQAMLSAANFVNADYRLDQDILLTGCLIHDIGKIHCYNWDTAIEMNDQGRLLHHTSIGYGMLQTWAIGFDGNSIFSNRSFLKLAHISHHDEEGIRKPMMPEAAAVAAIDAMDAVINHSRDFTLKPENLTDSNWTRFCQLTSRQYYVPGVKAEAAAPKPEAPNPKPKKEYSIFDE